MPPLTTEHFNNWLEQYGQAWERGDAEAVITLFTPGAHYYETPFDPPMIGHAAIRSYWQAGAGESQQAVHFTYQILSVGEEAGLARWQAEFTRVPSGVKVSLDGVLQASFDGHRSCTVFREWWHRQER